MPVLVFVCRHFGPPNLDLLGSVKDSLFTTVLSGERQAFFATIPAGYYFLYFLMLVPVGALVFFGRQKRKRSPAGARLILLLISIGIMSSWIYRDVFVHKYSLVRGIVEVRLGEYQPLGLPVSLALTAFDPEGSELALKQRAAFDYRAVRNPALDNVVFVIGESSRADHWSLNGYSRPTTPMLAAVPNLINFSNIFSLAPNTELSWPFFLTLKKAGDSGRYPETKSFISAFKEAGYDTYFISFYIDQNYSRKDSFAWIVFDADNVLNGLPPSNGQRRDDVSMLPAIRKILSAKGPKLIVISTQGSHPGFEHNCPLDYDVFTPSVLTEEFSPENYVNGYDDTIRMTDSFLASIIGLLHDSRSAMFYLSDHGIAVCDNGGQTHGSAFFKAEYRPSCVAWASDSFLDDAKNAGRFEQGKNHAGAPVTSEYVFHSFLDLCGVQTEKLDHTKSLFSPDMVVPHEIKVEDFLGRWHKFSEVPDNPN